MSDCKFCEALKNYKEIHAFGNRLPADQELGPYMHEYTVALVIHSWFKARGRRSASWSIDYGRQGLGFQPNFCPECGKIINKTKGAKP